MRDFGHRSVVYSGAIDRAIDDVVNNVGEGDAVLTLGAGNVWQAGERLLERLRK
jgi:UDP-N-acetylmuramate--alanine ligase